MMSTTLNKIARKMTIPSPTGLKVWLGNNKKTLKIFRDLQAGEKLGKQQDSAGTLSYYKVKQYRGMFVSRWWFGEGRQKTIKYLDVDFTEFMQFLDELLKHLEVDPFCTYLKMAKDTQEFIDDITPGLYSLKKTYPDCKEMVAKVDSIILTLIDFKDKASDLISQKEKGGVHLLVRTKSKSFEV